MSPGCNSHLASEEPEAQRGEVYECRGLAAERAVVGSHSTHRHFLVLESSVWCLGQDANCLVRQSISFLSSFLDAFPGSCDSVGEVSMLPLTSPSPLFLRSLSFIHSTNAS